MLLFSRFFVFSQLQVSNVIVSLDEKILCENARKAAEHFYVCPWNPEDYRVGIHHIKIFVEVRGYGFLFRSMQLSTGRYYLFGK